MKSGTPIDAVVVHFDHQCGQFRFDHQDERPRFLGVDVTPQCRRALEDLAKAKCTVALEVPPEVNGAARQQLKKLLRLGLVVASSKDDGSLLACCERLKTKPGRTLFVAADRVRRASAVRRRLMALPDLTLAAWAVAGHGLQLVSISGPRSSFDRLLQTMPYALEKQDDDSWTLLGVATNGDIARAGATGLRVETIAFDLAREDAVSLQIDACRQHDLPELRKLSLLSAHSRRLIVARGRSKQADRIELHGAHGHSQLLTPQPCLLSKIPAADHHQMVAQDELSTFPLDLYKVKVLDPRVKILPFVFLCPSASSIQSDVDRYSGVSNLDSAGPIVSRHSHHPDNVRAVDALIADLNAMGYCAYRHAFEFDGRTLHNVIADLPGSGCFIIGPDIIARIRKLFLKYPFPWPPEPWLRDLERLLGKKWLAQHGLLELDPRLLRWQLEHLFGLRPYLPWWREKCAIAGFGARIVIAGCHLDSTAGFDAGYDPTTDPAPGTDDDASGIAGVLSAARRLAAYRGCLTHTVRFCFFNAEESGLVGSKAYAAWMKSCNAPIKAVVCMDMMGYNGDENGIFEIHAGYFDSSVRDASVPIAEKIGDWTNTLGAVGPAQIYKGTSYAGSPDRDVYDGAINRSDHAAFHQQGYPAVVVSEDFFANLPSEPGDDPNPNYHRAADLTIDASYTANIVCAVTRAIRDLAS